MTTANEWPDLPADVRPSRVDHQLTSGVTLSAIHWPPALVPAGSAEGSPVPWLLVHGLASNARLWDGVARRLAALGHPVVAIDQRGHGQSSKPDDGYDMATVADDLHLLINDLGWSSAAVAGQSWGASVVLELGGRHPDVVKTLACVDGVLGGLKQRAPSWEEASDQLAPPALLGKPRSVIDNWLAQGAADWPEEGRAGTLASFDVRADGTIAPWLTFERHLLVLRGMWDYDPLPRYNDLEMPVLIIQADDGHNTEGKEASVDVAAERLATSRVEWFRPAHHDVHAQHPDQVSSLLHRAVNEPDFFPTSGASAP